MKFHLKRNTAFAFAILNTVPSFSFNTELLHSAVHKYDAHFHTAYLEYPEIPRGLLEAVAFSYTRIQHHQPDEAAHNSCLGMPETYGVMGLTENGKGFFKNNLKYVSVLSGLSKDELKEWEEWATEWTKKLEEEEEKKKREIADNE